jgi:nitrogenase subunit NifH
MKVFFLASIAVSKELRSSYLDVVSILESEGHKVNAKHSFITPEELVKKSQKSNEERAKDLLREMLTSDCVVFEGTRPSTGGGYYLSMALQKSIPVLFLIQEEYKGLYLASSNRLLKIKQYSPTNKKKLREIIQNFFAFAGKKRLSSRFNLMISDSMDDFLNAISKGNGVSKADYIRDLVYDEMEKNG